LALAHLKETPVERVKGFTRLTTRDAALFKCEPLEIKIKVMCILVQALRPCTDCTAHRGNRGIALLYRH